MRGKDECAHCLVYVLARLVFGEHPPPGQPLEVRVKLPDGRAWRQHFHAGPCRRHPEVRVEADTPPVTAPTEAPTEVADSRPAAMAPVSVSPTQRKVLEALSSTPVTAKTLFRLAGVKDNSRSRQALTALCRMRLVWHSPDGYCRP